jgi:hypothetical protein
VEMRCAPRLNKISDAIVIVGGLNWEGVGVRVGVDREVWKATDSVAYSLTAVATQESSTQVSCVFFLSFF